jgi:cytochrome c oxidase subunit IV
MRVTAFWIFRLTLAVFALAYVVVAFTTQGVLSLSAIVASGILRAVIIAISIKTRRSADYERKDS